MYTSDIDANAKRATKTAFVYLLISIFCALFGAVYEMFSHEVYSFFMIYAFAFPLIGGTLPFFILHLARAKVYPDTFSGTLYHSGIATVTVGSIVQGILEIYGTTNLLTKYYWMIGFLLIGSGSIAFGAAQEAQITKS
ncbi:MAG: hypothetical protein ACI4FZ_00330 [Lachnospiraceae bacterium]